MECKYHHITALLLVLAGVATVKMGSISSANASPSAQYPQETYLSVKLAPGTLIEKKRRAASAVSLKRQLGFLKSTGRYDAFKLKWHPSYDEPPTVWPIGTWLFWYVRPPSMRRPPEV